MVWLTAISQLASGGRGGGELAITLHSVTQLSLPGPGGESREGVAFPPLGLLGKGLELKLVYCCSKKRPHASVGTHGYMAPEVLSKGTAYDSSADWFR
jgi:hypothetical protein